MRKLIIPILTIVFGLSFVNSSCKNKEHSEALLSEKALRIEETPKERGEIYFDSILVVPFFEKHPLLKKYQPDVETLYKKHQYHYVWFDTKGINELGNLLYNKINNIKTEGIQVVVPYKEQLDNVFENTTETKKLDATKELLLSSLYFFYADKVYHGLDVKKTEELGWYLPRKKQSYVAYLDSLLLNPSLIDTDKKEVLGQYYRLKKVLNDYREIEKKGGWNTIELDPKFTSFKPGDSATALAQIRKRLYVDGDIKTDSKSAVYEEELKTGILSYKKRNGFVLNSTITSKDVAVLNVPIAARIKTIIINMERCRWIPADITKSKELIVINIPSYRLTYFKNDKIELISKVVVGKAMNKTVIFSADMKYIVFSPYWNVPRSIIKKELEPAMAKNKNYLAQHNMEWNGGNIRQKPGPKNSLGLVKFLFPNSNSIYLHDTPSKGLFNEEKRAFSHGCIRIEKPKELAIAILKEDKNWTPEKIDEAMHKGVESWYTLKSKIPVYIGYFTAWVDNEGVIHFYDDVYDRDKSLASLIFE